MIEKLIDDITKAMQSQIILKLNEMIDKINELEKISRNPSAVTMSSVQRPIKWGS